MGDLSRRPLKEVAPGVGGPAGPRWQTQLKTSRSLSSGSCSALLFTPLLTTRPLTTPPTSSTPPPASGRLSLCVLCVFIVLPDEADRGRRPAQRL